MKRLSNHEVKNKIVEIMVHFNDFCQKNNLQFYLCAGTLLGAVRHKGFIPWDDDVDLCMSRPQYDRLIDLIKKNDLFDDHYRIITFENNTSHYPYVKVLDVNTVTDQKYTNEKGENSLWIDVFPFDGVSEDLAERKQLFAESERARKTILLAIAKPFAANGGIIKHIVKPFAVLGAKIIGIARANKKIIQISKSINYHDANLVGDPTWGEYDKEIMSKREFEVSVPISFEGRKFCTMSCWRQYLSSTYGSDFMKLPPKEKRVSHDVIAWEKQLK